MQYQTGSYYHIYNRGVDKRDVFLKDNDYIRFLTSMREFNAVEPTGSLRHLEREPLKGQVAFQRLVEFVAYCLNPNHYHFLLKQVSGNGITIFMQRLGNGYTQYFNRRNNRSGSLFQGTFKAVPIENDGRFWEASFYINGNREIHGLGKAERWAWSSCPDYLGLRDGTLCNKNIILQDFSGIVEYKKLFFEYIKDKKEWKREERLLGA